MKKKFILKERKIKVIIYLIAFSILSLFIINNKLYQKLNNNLLLYNNGYIDTYDVEFYRIKVNIEINATNVKSCKFIINDKEEKIVNVNDNQCNYIFNNLKEGTEYKIKIVVNDTDDRVLYNIEKEIKTLTNLTNHVMELKDAPLGENHVYYHDAYLTLGANDNSYRYSGKEVNNWVCLGNTDEECQGDNLYRIIGAFKGEDNQYHIKLISADYINEDKLGKNGNRYDLGYEFSPNNNYLGSKDAIHTYYWFNKGSDLSGEWKDSLLNTNNLNKEFYDSLDTWKFISLPNVWEIIDNGNDINNKAKDIFNNEMNNQNSKTYRGWRQNPFFL